jgi:predicted glycosyltransferase
MKIIFDILHPAHLNLFKRSILELKSQNHTVHVLCINRGKLPLIVKHELPGVEVHFIGRHRGTKYSIIFEANLLRFLGILKFVFTHKIDVGISFGSFLMGMALKLKNKPNIHLSDDPERKMNEKLELLTCTERYLPPIVEPIGKTQIFNALKEWSYLSPDYFVSNELTLTKLGLKKKEYIFVREISTGSLNYINQDSNVIASFASKFPSGIKVVLSLEDKNMINLYPKDWILLKEPVDSIHSLIYFSKLVISSGDSMAREGAMLGVTSIYCGNRIMKANRILQDKGMLFHVENETAAFIETKINESIELDKQDSFRAMLKMQWIDVNQFIIKILLKYSKKIK